MDERSNMKIMKFFLLFLTLCISSPTFATTPQMGTHPVSLPQSENATDPLTGNPIPDATEQTLRAFNSDRDIRARHLNIGFFSCAIPYMITGLIVSSYGLKAATLAGIFPWALVYNHDVDFVTIGKWIDTKYHALKNKLFSSRSN
jgi:hypothetical protein